MKIIRQFLEDWIANLAQIGLLWIIVPLVCCLVSALNPSYDPDLTIIDMLGEIDIFNELSIIASTFVSSYDSSILNDSNALLNSAMNLLTGLEGSMFQILFITVCVEIMKILHNLSPIRGMPILATSIGVLIGSFIININDFPIMTGAFLLVLLFVVDMIFNQDIKLSRKALLFKLFLKYTVFCLKMTLTLLLVIFTTGFFATLYVILKGPINHIGMTVFILAAYIVPSFIVIFANKYILSKS